MRDYGELVMALRHCIITIPCDGCPYYSHGDKQSKECSTMNFSAADAIDELVALVPKWISVEEQLPKDGDIVLVYWYNVHCCERDNFSVMRFRKGRTSEELKQADFFRSCDQWGNNKRPYDWSDPHGPLSLFGQDVTHWMPLPDPPKEVE